MPLDALVSLVITFNEGIIVERLSGVTEGHQRAPRLDRRMAGARGNDRRAAGAREQTRARYPDA